MLFIKIGDNIFNTLDISYIKINTKGDSLKEVIVTTKTKCNICAYLDNIELKELIDKLENTKIPNLINL